ncbi:MAG: hypothetical protein PWQ55_2491 [Chloroflexota bacterium]|nr:hypothetical protein [Chloroflexota bacterium]
MTTTNHHRETTTATAPTITLSSRKIWSYFELTIVGLALLSLASQTIRYLTVYDEAFGLIPLVFMGKSLSIPTIFTVLLYFSAFVLLALITARKVSSGDRFRWHWGGLAALFLYLAFDKGTALHTYVFKQLRTWIRGWLPIFPRYNWIFTLTVMLIILGVFYIKFYRALPKQTRLLTVIALAVYYTGFLVIERFGDDYIAAYGANTLAYSVLVTLGKTLQMSGLAVAIYTLMDYMQVDMPDLFFAE